MKKILFLTVLFIGFLGFSQTNPRPMPHGVTSPFYEIDTMTTTQRDAMTIRAGKGRIIFNSTVDSLQFYNPTTTSWQALSQSTRLSDFTVSQKVNGIFGLSPNDGEIIFEYAGADVTNILFDEAFSKYLVEFETLIGSKSINAVIFNKTQEKTLIGDITAITANDVGGTDYYSTSINLGDMAETDIAVNDEIEVYLSVSDSGSNTSEWATSTGTRAGGDLVVTLGDYDDSGNATKLTIDDANGTSTFSNSVFSDTEIGTSGNQADISIIGNSTSIGASISTLENMHIQSGNTTPASATTRLTLDEDGIGINANSSTFTLANKGYIKTNNLTAQRDYELPDASGTIALTSDITGSGHTIQDEGVNITQKDTLNFIGAGVSVANVGDVTTVTIDDFTLTTNGINGAATYSGGVLNVPQYTVAPTTSSSTTINLSNIINNYAYASAASTADTFTLASVVTGGKATVLIDTTGDSDFPTVTGSTQTNSAPFEEGVEYYMIVENNGDRTEHYFVKRDIGLTNVELYKSFTITDPTITTGEYTQEILPALAGKEYVIVGLFARSDFSVNPTDNLSLQVRYNGNTNNIVSGTIAFSFDGDGTYSFNSAKFINGDFTNTAVDLRLAETTDESLTGTITGYIKYIVFE